MLSTEFRVHWSGGPAGPERTGPRWSPPYEFLLQEEEEDSGCQQGCITKACRVFSQLNYCFWDFPGGQWLGLHLPVWRWGAGGLGLILSQGAKVQHASWPKNQNMKQKKYRNKFNGDLNNGPHQKRNY